MFNPPKTPAAAASIFIAGLLAVGYTTWDASQKAILNEKPMTPEQQEALRQHIQQLRKPPKKKVWSDSLSRASHRTPPSLYKVKKLGMRGAFLDCTGFRHLNSATKRGLAISCPARLARRCPAAARCSSISSRVAEAFQQLGLTNYGSKDDVRAAYLSKMKQLHPDLNPGGQTTELAARITVAYHDLMQGFLDGTIGDLSDIDVFDSPEGEPDHIFINPFACNISPLEWRELQHIATTAANNVEDALSRHGVYMQTTAVAWLTAAQLQSITADLTAMEADFSFETTSWLISDCLLRAGRANNMIPMAS